MNVDDISAVHILDNLSNLSLGRRRLRLESLEAVVEYV